MNQPASIVGIDVSKATLAVCYQVADKPQHLEVSNSKAGFLSPAGAISNQMLGIVAGVADGGNTKRLWTVSP